MSEFTTGNLFPAIHSQQVSDYLQDKSLPFLIEQLNERWSALFLEDDWLSDPSTVSMLIDLSQNVPILHFQNAEDHGWGYRVFADRKEQAHFFDDYGLDHALAVELAEARYPEIMVVEHFLYLEPKGQEVMRQLLKEVKQLPAYQSALAQQFQSKNVQAFAYFDIAADIVKTLDRLITPENLEGEPPRQEVNTFLEQLGITGMEWKSYHYLSGLVE